MVGFRTGEPGRRTVRLTHRAAVRNTTDKTVRMMIECVNLKFGQPQKIRITKFSWQTAGNCGTAKPTELRCVFQCEHTMLAGLQPANRGKPRDAKLIQQARA